MGGRRVDNGGPMPKGKEEVRMSGLKAKPPRERGRKRECGGSRGRREK